MAGYFYAVDSALIENPVIQLICQLGGGKGALTRYFFLMGIQKLLIYRSVTRFIHAYQEEGNTIEEMMVFVT